MAQKKPVEIETLLRWAFVDELSKRITSSAEGIWDHIEEIGQRGGIDPGHGAAQRYPHFGLPHPDAEKIELAVSALPNLIIDWKESREALMGDLFATSCWSALCARPRWWRCTRKCRHVRTGARNPRSPIGSLPSAAPTGRR